MTILEKKIAKNIDIIKSGNITRLKREDDKNHEFIYFHDFLVEMYSFYKQ